MQINFDTISCHVKCPPFHPISSNKTTSPYQIINHWLPPILPKIIKDDFQEFFINKISGKLGWLRSCVDSSFSSFKVRFDLGGYRGLSDFIFWDDNLEGHFLERMIPLLHFIANCTPNQLTVEQFVELATDLCQWANFPLTPFDVRIITSLHQMPTLTIPALAKLLQTSYKKTRARWTRLQRLNILRITALPSYQSLGLQPVVIEFRDTRHALVSPYVLSKLKLEGEENKILYTMVVPEDQLGALARCLRSQIGSTYTLYLARRHTHTLAFTHYQFNKHNWKINWRKLFLGAHLVHSEYDEPDPAKLFTSSQRQPQPYVPDEKDTRLIPVLMADARMKLEQLARIVSMSLSQVSRRRSKLIEKGILRLEPVLRRIGLIEDIVLWIREDDPRLLGIVEELPQTWITQLTDFQEGNKHIMVYSTLPAGSFAMIRYYLSQYLPSISRIFLSGPESGGWPLSFENYDCKEGSWIWTDPLITKEKEQKMIPSKGAPNFSGRQKVRKGEEYR